jgi:hypothetical protein
LGLKQEISGEVQTMKPKITVDTRFGRRGAWVTEYEIDASPRNLLKAAREKRDRDWAFHEKPEYQVVLRVDGVTLDKHALYDIDIARARDICNRPGDYAE